MLNISKTVAQYEQQDVRAAWEPPHGFDGLVEAEKWIVHGRKGSGKTTLVDYLRATNPDGSVVVVRPRFTEMYGVIKDLRSHVSDERLVARAVEQISEILLTLKAMKEQVQSRPQGPQTEVMKLFLRQNSLEGSATLVKAIGWLRTITENFKNVSELAELMGRMRKPGYWEATHVMRTIFSGRGNSQRLLICVDEVDEVGFSYSDEDRLIVSALINLCMRVNQSFLADGVAIRLLLTPPTELYSNAHLWGRDKANAKAFRLSWEDPEKLRNVVNRKIGLELGVRSRRSEGRRYSSASTEQTWARVFPKTIKNKNYVLEEAFVYGLRHTLYTPRSVLGVFQAVLDRARGRGWSLETIGHISTDEWSEVFQGAVEEASLDLAAATIDTYGLLFEGIQGVLDKFSGRPAIWTSETFDEFLAHCLSEGPVTRMNDGARLELEAVRKVLYEMGFVGYGAKNLSSAAGSRSFLLSFSYLAGGRGGRSRDLMVISPVFFDSLGIRPVDAVVIIPHSILSLRSELAKQIEGYRPSLNPRK